MTVKVQTKYRKGRFEFLRIGGNHIAIYPFGSLNDPDDFFKMTGSDIDNYIDIDFFHRINKLVVVHLDSSYALSTDALKVILELEQGRSLFHSKFTDILFSESGIIDSTLTEIFGEGFEYEPRTWTLTLNSTNTDIVMPVLYIQKLG